MPWRERNDGDRAAALAHFTGADDRRFRVIAPFDQHVRAQHHDELEWSVLLEDHHRVDRLESRQHVTPFGSGAHRPRGTLEAAHRVVTVDADDQKIALAPRGNEDVDVSGMQQVEHAIREDNPPGPRVPPQTNALPVHDLVERIHRAFATQNGPSAFGLK